MLVRNFPNAAGLDLPCLLFHPVMDSINLNLFRASVEKPQPLLWSMLYTVGQVFYLVKACCFQ